MITFDNVTKIYRVNGFDKVVIRDLNMTFPFDRNIGILGQNGAGKSTLMRLIAGAELPTAGRIKRHANVSWPLGFSGGFNGYMTGLENARFVARMYGQDVDDVVEFVEDFSELGPSLNMPIATYSSGMRARLAFGVSMAVKFSVYLIDEITAVGDARFKRKCEEVFSQKLQESKIIMISHGMGTLRKFCDAGCVLQNGELYYFDDIEVAIDLHEHNQNE